ncbi:3-oxoacyl-[acyl-carrier-protein] reductase FabG [bioreactor metagenome]|uniref:3-oxoacyl-[acyl-carrier-protein] reductase FabG n=1 Tax=bioreactor metagenome TaxID=1076179 RepID=A0A644Y1Z6_9ZZZZ
MMSLNLQSAVVPVTGAASGIGLAICKRLHAEGATPLLLDFDEPKLQSAVQEVYGASAAGTTHPPKGYLLDVRSSQAVNDCFARIHDEHGGITHAVSNAGRAGAAHILDITDQQWRDVLDVNLDGTVYFCRAAARQLAERKGGAIVNLASIAGFGAKESRVAYNSSKAAVVNMTRALALDLGPLGIRVNAVAPGIIDTPMQQINGPRPGILERTALKRTGTPDEMAKVVLFLLSDMASYVTGETIIADGGITCRYC